MIRRRVSDGTALVIAAALAIILGLAALANGLFLDSTARVFKSAADCEPGIEAPDCLQQRKIQITGVGTGRYGEVNAVDFVDNGTAHEVNLAVRAKDPSVLQPGASGTATLWRGNYTDLDVAGTDFVTDENPIGRQGLWILFGVIGIGFALVLGAGSIAWTMIYRRPAE